MCKYYNNCNHVTVCNYCFAFRDSWSIPAECITKTERFLFCNSNHHNLFSILKMLKGLNYSMTQNNIYLAKKKYNKLKKAVYAFNNSNTEKRLELKWTDSKKFYINFKEKRGK